VEFKEYLQLLCEDLSGLLFLEGSGYAIVAEGAKAEIPTTMAIPLGFIVNAHHQFGEIRRGPHYCSN
jgi:hypothetical protein